MKKLLFILLLPVLIQAGAWVSPTGNNNPGAWSNPTNGYDGDTTTSTGRSGVPAQSLILYRAATNCDSIKFKGGADNSSVSVHYGGSYTVILNGAWTGAFTVYALADTYSVDSVKFTNNGTASTMYEFYYWDTDSTVAPPAASGDTTFIGTADGKTVTSGVWFDGTTDSLTVADADVFSFTDGAGTDRPFSVSAMIYMVSANYFVIINKRGGAGVEYNLITSTANKLSMIIYNGGTKTIYIGRYYNTDLTALQNTWIHVVMTYDGSEGNEGNEGIKLYINGVRVDDTNLSSGLYAGMSNTAEMVSIGYRREAPAFYANGYISHQGIFDHALSTSEINMLYRTNGAMAEVMPGLVEYWEMDGIPGQPALSVTGINGYNATGGGDVQFVATPVWPSLNILGTADGSDTIKIGQ